MRERIFFKLLAAFIVVIALATATLDFAVRKAWEDSLHAQIETSLKEKVRLFANAVEQERDRRTMQQIADQVSADADARATIIRADGLVLADTRANPAEMENHATRPEFIAALRDHTIGENTRVSHTVGIPFLYVAAPIQGGAVRLAYPLSAIQALTHKVRMRLLGASGLALLLALVLAAVIAQSISRRLQRIVVFAEKVAAGDLTARIAETASDEIAHVAAALDRTARKLEESFAAIERGRRELETLLNSMQDAVLSVSPDGRVLWANGPMSRLARVATGAPVVESVRDPEFLKAVEEAISTRQARHARVTTLAPARAFAATVAPMPGGGAVAVLHDLTEVERVEKTRRDFIANVSHELRTPLTSIQGYAETLLEGGVADAASAREFLEIIRKNASRMSRLTEDLLVLARVESGEQRFSFRSIPAREVLEDAAQAYRDRAKFAGMDLTVEDSTSRPVLGDADALHQVLSNLIDNAVKYGASAQGLRIGARDAANGVEFYVRDFGPGIASEHLPRLFERFYRVDKARSRESGGTGLGLAIAKHIVRAHGGSIHAASELNHGSIFSFVVPFAETRVDAGVESTSA